MLKAVIFDFDGVIADSEKLHFRAFQIALKKYDIDITKQLYYEKYLGFSDKDCVAEFNKDFGMGLDEIGRQKIIDEKGVLFNDLAEKENTIIDGVAEFLQLLDDNSIRKAICSGALLDEIEVALKPSGFRNAFENIVAADHVEKGKPDPEGYLLAMKNLNNIKADSIVPSECIVIEDSFWGLEAAEKAGMHRIAVTNTYSADQLKPYSEKVVETLTDLNIHGLENLCS